MRIEYPNGSAEIWTDPPVKIWICTEIPNPINGKIWTINTPYKLFGAGNNGIRRRGKRWRPSFEHGVGWTWFESVE